jgi:zinc protease
MISFKRFELSNGLRCLIHTDPSAQVCALSVLYLVGSRDEQPHQTGIAHLFEHLMFSGSKHAKSYDRPLQQAGGENNAFTNNDFTNYYGVVPMQNIDTLFWLESDRMADLTLNEKKLKNQKSVVVEEFKETCLNEPYGDVWHHLSAMAYNDHPYSWPVIGKTISHINSVNLQDAVSFYQRFYDPSNAILCLSGPENFTDANARIEKWFGDIPSRFVSKNVYVKESKQNSERRKEILADVPANALYIAFHAYDRQHPLYYASDLLTDILANGRSSRLYRKLVKEQEIFTNIDAYITGTFDMGLLVIEGKVSSKYGMAQAEAAVWEVLNDLKFDKIDQHELQKIKNKAESSIVFSELGIMYRSINLCFYEALGDADIINKETAFYQAISADDIQKCALDLLHPDKANVLWYLIA